MRKFIVGRFVGKTVVVVYFVGEIIALLSQK